MARINVVKDRLGDVNSSGSFFYDDWLLAEMRSERKKAFVPQVATEEDCKEHRLTFTVQNLRKEHCSIEVDFPYLYVRIQQKQLGLLALLSRRPIVHIFARHFVIPYNVDTEGILLLYKTDKLIIRLPKYYLEVE